MGRAFQGAQNFYNLGENIVLQARVALFSPEKWFADISYLKKAVCLRTIKDVCSF